MELTREYLDKQLGKLATKDELKKLATKDDIKSVKDLVKTEIGRLDTKISRLDMKIETEITELAGMVSRRFDEVEKKLDVRAEVDQLKSQMEKVWNALNIVSK